MQISVPQAVAANFLGKAPGWYKQSVVAFLIINPLLFLFNPYIAGWALVLKFYFHFSDGITMLSVTPGRSIADASDIYWYDNTRTYET